MVIQVFSFGQTILSTLANSETTTSRDEAPTPGRMGVLTRGSGEITKCTGMATFLGLAEKVIQGNIEMIRSTGMGK